MTEVALWEKLKLYLPRGKYTRIETGETGPGTPDVYYRLQGFSGWIELKDAQHPRAVCPFPNDQVGLHRSQIQWISWEVNLGGVVWIIARVGAEIFFIDGRHCRKFNGAPIRSLRRLASFRLTSRPTKKDLRQIRLLMQEGAYHASVYLSGLTSI